jgi:hypothetical protein
MSVVCKTCMGVGLVCRICEGKSCPHDLRHLNLNCPDCAGTGVSKPKSQKPAVHRQGKAVVESAGVGSSWKLLVMMPDGAIIFTNTPARALKAIKTWFKENTDDKAINVGMIEWRDNIQPPKEAKRGKT